MFFLPTAGFGLFARHARAHRRRAPPPLFPRRSSRRRRSLRPVSQVTFTKDIAPILQRSCQNCHRPNSVAPMSLLTYEEVRPYASAIKRRTGIRSRQGTMPPWYIEKDIGIQQYKNDVSLSDEEVAKIAPWADNGAPRGNPADMPPPLDFADRRRVDDRHARSRRHDAAGQCEGREPDWWGEPASPIRASPRIVTSRRSRSRKSTTLGRASPGPTRSAASSSSTTRSWAFEAPGPRPARRPRRRMAGARSRTQRRRVQSRGRETAARRLARRLSRTCTCTRTARTRPGTSRSAFKFHPKGYKPKMQRAPHRRSAPATSTFAALEAGQKIEAFMTLHAADQGHGVRAAHACRRACGCVSTRSGDRGSRR